MKSRTVACRMVSCLIVVVLTVFAIAAVAPSPVAASALASVPASVTAWEFPVRSTPVTRILMLGNIHIRTGPGLGFKIVGTLPVGDTATVTGISNSLNWWRIRCPWGGTCWVSANPFLTQPIAWRK